MSNYDVIIIGAGPGGIFAAYELAEKAPELKVAVSLISVQSVVFSCPIARCAAIAPAADKSVNIAIPAATAEALGLVKVTLN